MNIQKCFTVTLTFLNCRALSQTMKKLILALFMRVLMLKLSLNNGLGIQNWLSYYKIDFIYNFFYIVRSQVMCPTEGLKFYPFDEVICTFNIYFEVLHFKCLYSENKLYHYIKRGSFYMFVCLYHIIYGQISSCIYINI